MWECMKMHCMEVWRAPSTHLAGPPDRVAQVPHFGVGAALVPPGQPPHLPGTICRCRPRHRPRRGPDPVPLPRQLCGSQSPAGCSAGAGVRVPRSQVGDVTVPLSQLVRLRVTRGEASLGECLIRGGQPMG